MVHRVTFRPAGKNTLLDAVPVSGTDPGGVGTVGLVDRVRGLGAWVTAVVPSRMGKTSDLQGVALRTGETS